MVYLNKIIKSTILILFISIVCGCNSTTEETIDKRSVLFPNGIHIVVEKVNKATTSTGIITKHTYNISHSFTYNFELDKDNVTWDGGSAEPKEILFCKDTTYLRYLKEKELQIAQTDSLDGAINYEYQLKLVELFQKHIDKRYFFNLLGDDYWIEIPSENYPIGKNECQAFDIPNDNELSLTDNNDQH